MNSTSAKHERLQIRVSLTDRDRMAKAAKRRGVSLSEFVRLAANRAAGIAA